MQASVDPLNPTWLCVLLVLNSPGVELREAAQEGERGAHWLSQRKPGSAHLCHLHSTHRGYCVFCGDISISDMGSRGQAVAPPDLALAGPCGLGSAPQPGLSTTLRTQAEARGKAHRLRMHVTTHNPCLGSSQLTCER